MAPIMQDMVLGKANLMAARLLADALDSGNLQEFRQLLQSYLDTVRSELDTREIADRSILLYSIAASRGDSQEKDRLAHGVMAGTLEREEFNKLLDRSGRELAAYREIYGNTGLLQNVEARLVVISNIEDAKLVAEVERLVGYIEAFVDAVAAYDAIML